tara:strand:- start:71 stop:1279 length:1209 start_codon:yes stop_codon:yes gene_type:complete
MNPISFIIPSRNNLKYLKWCYNSIRKNSSPIHEICIADDASKDDTREWVEETMKVDPDIKFYVNEESERKGLTILYDLLVNEYATHDRVMFFHSDMYLCPGADEMVEKYLRPNKVVTLTRIEPPLHPDGPEKILMDFGIEPEEFDEQRLLNFAELNRETYGFKVTEGIFAPWAIYKKDFQSIGGHDKLFVPQSKEDSDIFNRMHLKGYEFIQTWKGLVYHMTSRGSRFNPMAGGAPGKDSPEWKYTTTKNMRNFIRKWGTAVQHDAHMKPIISPKYDIGFIVNNCTYELLEALEPWCSNIQSTPPTNHLVGHESIFVYRNAEQKNTLFDLGERVKLPTEKMDNGILVEFDGSQLINESFQFLTQLPEILHDSGEVGEMKYDIFRIMINSLQTYEKENIKCKR